MIEVQRPQDPTRGYRVEVRREEDDSWTLLVPALAGLAVAAESIEDGWRELPDVIDLWLEAAESQGLTIPDRDATTDVSYSGKFMVRMPRTLHAALARRAEIEGTSINLLCVAAITEAVARAGFVRNTSGASRYRHYGVELEQLGEAYDVAQATIDHSGHLELVEAKQPEFGATVRSWRIGGVDRAN